MKQISNEDVSKFVELCDGDKFNGPIDVILFYTLHKNDDIVKHLLDNNTSFNILIDKDGSIVTVPIDTKSNVTMKFNDVVKFRNKNVLNVGLILHDGFGDSPTLSIAVGALLRQLMSNGFTPKYNKTIFIINYKLDNESIFTIQNDTLIHDIVFTYFRSML